MPISRNDLLKWALVVILPALCFIIPLSDIYTTQVRWFFVITICGLTMAALEVVRLGVIGALMPAFWYVLNVAPLPVIMSPYTSSVMYMTIGAFIFAAAAEQSGLLKRLSFWMMAKVNGNYWALLYGIFFTGAVLTLLTFGLMSHIIMAALCLGLCKALNIMDTKFSAVIAMSIMLGTCASHCFVYNASAYAVIGSLAGGLVNMSDLGINALTVTLHNWPMMVVCMLTLWVIGKWYQEKRTLESKTYFEEQLQAMGPIKKSEKAVGIILVLMLLFLFTQSWHKMDCNLAFMFLPWLLFFPGIDSADADTIKAVNWEMILFFAACMSIGMIAGNMGLGGVIVNFVTPILQANGGSLSVVIGTVFAIIFGLNFLMTPTAIWALITQPLLQIAQALDIGALPMIYALVHCSEAIIFPYEYVPYLLVFSFGMISMKDFIKMSLVRCVIYALGLMLLLIPYWQLIGIA